jgi:hypothetical protein
MKLVCVNIQIISFNLFKSHLKKILKSFDLKDYARID